MSYIDTAEYTYYQLNPPPPKWEPQEYIEKYFQTKDKKYFSWFLHAFEPVINERAKRLRAKYSMEEHFSDIKQSYIVGIYKALEHYDLKYNVPFEAYLIKYAEREVNNYIRTMRTGYSVQSENEYARLRKAMAILMALGGDPSDDNISKVAEQLNIPFERAQVILTGGLRNYGYTDVYYRNDNDEEAENDALLLDDSSDPKDLYEKGELYEKLYKAFDSLEFTEKIMLSQHFGFCPDCFSIFAADKTDLNEYGEPKLKRIKPQPYTDIATSHGFSNADTAKKNIAKAMKKLKKALIA